MKNLLTQWEAEEENLGMILDEKPLNLEEELEKKTERSKIAENLSTWKGTLRGKPGTSSEGFKAPLQGGSNENEGKPATRRAGRK